MKVYNRVNIVCSIIKRNHRKLNSLSSSITVTQKQQSNRARDTYQAKVWTLRVSLARGSQQSDSAVSAASAPVAAAAPAFAVAVGAVAHAAAPLVVVAVAHVVAAVGVDGATVVQVCALPSPSYSKE